MQSKKSVYFKHLLNSTLQCAFSFLTFVRLYGEMLTICNVSKLCTSQKHERLAFSLRRWCSFLPLILSADEFVCRFSSLFIMKLIKEDIC
jgi:hypothetical protein